MTRTHARVLLPILFVDVHRVVLLPKSTYGPSNLAPAGRSAKPLSFVAPVFGLSQ